MATQTPAQPSAPATQTAAASSAKSTQDISNKIKTATPALPQIYAYTTPEIARHAGWTKIGYTEQNVEERVKQQTHTANVQYIIHWHGNATYEDTGATFRDTDFHGYLKKLDVACEPNTEWYEIEPSPAKMRFYEFRENHGVLDAPAAIEYKLRAEQEAAATQTAQYAKTHDGGEFLWNAKPRFGKTLTAYDFCRRAGAARVLIVTNRPAIANSWYDDYVKFVGPGAGFAFVSNTPALAGKPYCLTREEYLKQRINRKQGAQPAQGAEHSGAQGTSSAPAAPSAHTAQTPPAGFIEFVSLQDLKGAISFGGAHDKLEHIAQLDWDVLIIDEAHEGVDTLKTDVAFDHIKRHFTLHLSGTPFKAIANEKFPAEAIFNWTYADEQTARENWTNTQLPNPYADLPRLNMFTYQMSSIVEDVVAHGCNIDGEAAAYAFDLNEFFATTEGGYFTHNDQVDRFLDALTTQKKFPFSTPELRDKLRHTFWMLNRVSSARALARKLNKHPVFREYEIVLAAGDGKLDEETENTKAFDRVRQAISAHDKTITLSVGQLTTGVTIPEWTGVLMLSNMKSPSLYMQAAFRAQNPCLFSNHGKFFRKENAYVFDFDPARTLTIFEEFANDLYTDTAAGSGTSCARKQRIRTLLNFFPVIGEDDAGQMCELDAERVLSIPRKIRSREVVRRGFMCDFLFQNIAGVFHAPAQVREVLSRLEAVSAPNEPLGVTNTTASELSLNEEGEVDVPQNVVIGLAGGLFGEKVYGDIEEDLEAAISDIKKDKTPTEEDMLLDNLLDVYNSAVVQPLIENAKENYGSTLTKNQQNNMARRIKADLDIELNRKVGDFKIERTCIEHSRQEALEAVETQEAADAVNSEYDAQLVAAREALAQKLGDSHADMVKSAGETVVAQVETATRENKKQTIESGIRDHLRGFSRTIPSFLMAYGNENTTLSVFDSTVPEQVFYDVTSITVEEFRLLRDGGDVADPETGEVVHFAGQLFDPVVFNDSVREFMGLRAQLANYFDEGLEEDIFDYVPPQKTNQIFTPREVVVQMLDLFEAENPGCFDSPAHTFADLYMKSGLYIAEVVKRLYRSPGMRAAFPDNLARLRHILNNQVYGAAPTEIIYQIATNYILGFEGGARGGGEGVRDANGSRGAVAGVAGPGAEGAVSAARGGGEGAAGARGVGAEGVSVSGGAVAGGGGAAMGVGCTGNFVCADAAVLARAGKLEQFVQDTFGEKLAQVEEVFGK